MSETLDVRAGPAGRPARRHGARRWTTPRTGARPDTDVLVVDDRIAAVGPGLEVPEGTVEIDATDGIVMPGMIDTHRHMWQTAMRGYGADWTLTQYFVWYYLESGKALPPRGRARRQPARRHRGARRRRHHHASTGRTACRPPTTPTPPSTRCRRCPAGSSWPTATSRQAPAEWIDRRRSSATSSPAGITRRRHARLPAGLRRHRRPGVPGAGRRSRWPASSACRSPRTPGVWGATNDDGIRLMHENGFMTPETDLRARRDAVGATPTTASPPPAARSRCPPRASRAPGQGYPPTWALRAHGIPVSLSMDTSVWWSGDLFSAMRTTLGADRSREHLEAHAKGDTVTHCRLRAEQVVEWATRGGARALGRDGRPRQPRGRQEGRRRADQERRTRR